MWLYLLQTFSVTRYVPIVFNFTCIYENVDLYIFPLACEYNKVFRGTALNNFGSLIKCCTYMHAVQVNTYLYRLSLALHTAVTNVSYDELFTC